MKVAVGADHAGFDLKVQLVPWLESSGHEVVDVGAHTLDPADDFPDFAAAVAHSINDGVAERGVMVCGSGVGASIATNKVSGIRACLCHDTYTARQGVEHNNMNDYSVPNLPGGACYRHRDGQGCCRGLSWSRLHS